VTDATASGSLVRAGAGTTASPYTLDVADGGIGTAELATDAVTTIKITDANVTLAKLADGATTGNLLQWNGTAWVEVAETAITATKSITAQTTDYTVLTSDYTIILNSGGSFTTGVTLPTPAAGNTGRIYVLRNNSGAGVAIAGAGTGGPTTIPDASAVWVQSNGTSWLQIN
uniref:hypothetical protein n=1 Tax=Eudoraea algarum TaxID=3417568 RepID=UPI003D35B3CA